MNGNRTVLILGVGCLLLIALLIVAIPVGFFTFTQISSSSTSQGSLAVATVVEEVMPVPTAPPAQQDRAQQAAPPAQPSAAGPSDLTPLYQRVNPGVVNIRIEVSEGPFTGQGAGSGFVLDDEGHIVTNNHVVATADRVIVVFYDGIEAEAEVIGTDADSDLAVVRVDEMPEGVHPLSVGDSDQVQAGDWVVAIGNPFGQQSSMTTGIVSAVGRMIPSLVEGFSIPQAIQTDAAINPGNSGGPLLNLQGEVIGVNAQIRSEVRANAGVGFAIPAKIVDLVTPSLIEEGSYTWPWLGVSTNLGISLLKVMQANDFSTQQGAYIVQVTEGSPADEAGIQGASGTRTLDGVQVPTGGDLIVEADGERITSFNDLLVTVALKKPGDEIDLTVLRDGRRVQLTATLEPRPDNVQP